MIGQFVVVEGPDKGKSYPVEAGTAMLIGRGQLYIPDSFEGSIMRMLAKAPADRFQTPTELLRDFERMAKFSGVTINS